jgi:hypothetical protein
MEMEWLELQMEFCNLKKILIMKTLTPCNAPLSTLSLQELDTRLYGLVQAFQGREKTREYEEDFNKISEELKKRL